MPPQISDFKGLPNFGRYLDPDSNPLEPLREEYPWLKQLDSSNDTDSKILRKPFLEDGYNFLKILTEFLKIRKWQEFVHYTIISDEVLRPVLYEAVRYLYGNEFDKKAAGSEIGSASREELALEALKIPRENPKGFAKALRLRCDEVHASDNFIIRYKEVDLIQNFKKLGLKNEDLTKRWKLLRNQIWQVRRLNTDQMTFKYDIAESSKPEPSALLSSPVWRKIGRNLCSLGLLVGADVPRSRKDPKRISIVAALQKAVNAGPAINIMLARLEEQSDVIRKQNRAISALQFRHVLEMLPEGGLVPKTGQATPQWKGFWRKAVENAYNEYVSIPPPLLPGHQWKSPLVDLLKDKIDKTRNREDKKGRPHTKKAKIKWLQEETNISQRAKELFGTLSEVIHEYSSDEFSINSAEFSPGDFKLLQSLTPLSSNIVDGTVDWNAEKNRYT